MQTSVAFEGAAINDIAEMKMGFMVSLRSRNRSPKTIKSYMEAVDLWAVDRHTVKKPLILA